MTTEKKRKRGSDNFGLFRKKQRSPWNCLVGLYRPAKFFFPFQNHLFDPLNFLQEDMNLSALKYVYPLI